MYAIIVQLTRQIFDKNWQSCQKHYPLTAIGLLLDPCNYKYAKMESFIALLYHS